ncbi:MAG TPA: RNA polymerase sigma factor [Candidatus Eisenbacteria bacterium]|nr:RNA polymerase sigma factor [Candidatus Eisenbacteria bacterium]
MGEIDEQTLAERAKRGDDRAFTKLVEMYERVIYNLAFRMTNDREDARDIAQTVFVKAYRKLSSFDPRHRFFSWIYRIGVNECLNHRARSRRFEELDPDLMAEGGAGDADERASTLLRSEAIEDSLMSLSVDYRTVIILRHFLELNQAEMAQILDVPEKTVKSRLHTARQLMAGQLGRRGIHQS